MGNYLTKGTTFADGGPCNAALLNAHVDDAIIKATAISSQALKDPSALSDEILINDGGTLKKTTLQQLHNMILYSGSVVQTVYAEYTANTNLTTVMPVDDTVPQNTEGTEILSASITPRFATSTILVVFTGQAASNVNVSSASGLFRDSVVGAIASESSFLDGAGIPREMSISYMDSPATTSSTTYKIRVGPGGAATIRFNGLASGRLLAGSSRATLVLQEIKV